MKLLAFDHARLDGVYITQKHEPGRVALQLRVDVQKAGRKNICRFGRDEEELEGLSWRVKVTDPDGKVILTETCPEQAVIENPRLWWPNGYGEQPLYLVEAELLRMEKYWIAGAAVSACAR